jgi:hypothetical protein
MDELKAVVLPTSQAIMQRLTALFDDELARRIYAKVAKRGGQEIYGSGLVLAFTLALEDECKGYPPVMRNLVWLWIPKWVEALIDDPEALAQAKAFWEEVDQKFK